MSKKTRNEVIDEVIEEVIQQHPTGICYVVDLQRRRAAAYKSDDSVDKHLYWIQKQIDVRMRAQDYIITSLGNKQPKEIGTTRQAFLWNINNLRSRIEFLQNLKQ